VTVVELADTRTRAFGQEEHGRFFCSANGTAAKLPVSGQRAVDEAVTGPGKRSAQVGRDGRFRAVLFHRRESVGGSMQRWCSASEWGGGSRG
jgi:hypothetical protein